MVSVIMITYNHESFIKEAIEGVLMQKCDFEVELIVADDNSPDNTLGVVENIIVNHDNGHWIKYTKHEENKGMKGNFLWAVDEVNNKYISLCEGDDYWTDPYKLQKQVDILEKNEDCILVCSGFKSIFSDGREETYIASLNESIDKEGFLYTLEDASKKWLTKTLTAVFRNNKSVFNEMNKYTVSYDTHLFYHLLKEGKGYYFKQVMGVYNRHDGGVASSLSSSEKNSVSYNIYKEMFALNRDEYCRKNYFTVSIDILNDLVSFKRGYKGFNLLPLLYNSLKLIKTNNEFIIFIKSLIPYQIKHKFK